MPRNHKIKRISFNLKKETGEEIENLSQSTRIKKSDLIKLMIEKNHQIASELNLSARKKQKYTSYTNILIPQEMYEQLLLIVETSNDESAKIGTVARAIVEYSLQENNFLPFQNYKVPEA